MHYPVAFSLLSGDISPKLSAANSLKILELMVSSLYVSVATSVKKRMKIKIFLCFKERLKYFLSLILKRFLSRQTITKFMTQKKLL